VALAQRSHSHASGEKVMPYLYTVTIHGTVKTEEELEEEYPGGEQPKSHTPETLRDIQNIVLDSFPVDLQAGVAIDSLHIMVTKGG
jgi:hypothetical protein